MQALNAPELLDYLRQRGLIGERVSPKIIPLDGGVSSAIYLVEEEDVSGRSFVVKQALEKLRVSDDWRCDPARNLYEQEFMAVAEEFLPGSVPQLLHCDRECALFVMEYLGEGWATWKARLCNHEFSGETAAQTGRLLGSLHRQGWGQEDLARRFDSGALFHELRVSPYLLTSAARHPKLASLLKAEADRLDRTRITLVHGDYSPKNLMTKGSEVKVLDAEVACFSDPAFDVAFLMNHLLLKAIRFPEHFPEYSALRDIFLQAYRESLAEHWSGELETRAARLTLILMIARISGKSPVEYFAAGSPEARSIVDFASAQLISLPCAFSFSELHTRFQNAFSYDHCSH